MHTTASAQNGISVFGEELRRAREARGLALEAVCAATKVPARHIRALESGTYAELPGGVFRRGFVRSYVSALGLEEADWMKRFEESCRASGVRDSSGTDWAAFAENVKSNRGEGYRRMKIGGLAVAVLLITLGTGGWCAWRIKTHQHMLPAKLARLAPIHRHGKSISQ